MPQPMRPPLPLPPRLTRTRAARSRGRTQLQAGVRRAPPDVLPMAACLAALVRPPPRMRCMRCQGLGQLRAACWGRQAAYGAATAMLRSSWQGQGRRDGQAASQPLVAPQSQALQHHYLLSLLPWALPLCLAARLQQPPPTRQHLKEQQPRLMRACRSPASRHQLRLQRRLLALGRHGMMRTSVACAWSTQPWCRSSRACTPFAAPARTSCWCTTCSARRTAPSAARCWRTSAPWSSEAWEAAAGGCLRVRHVVCSVG
mmetsp:Transcript_9565/g.23697  ORF Transcript_9565/g.23697 Transcript_9565/m.23697 type:complete len:258 (+) Transcript_9565:733-1506(+)